MLNPLLNPPADLKVRMCREYMKQMALRHAGALGEFKEKTRIAAETHLKTPKVRGPEASGADQHGRSGRDGTRLRWSTESDRTGDGEGRCCAICDAERGLHCGAPLVDDEGPIHPMVVSYARIVACDGSHSS